MHSPANEVDKICFGTLTKNDKAPDYLYMDYDESYCNQVWSNMKQQAVEKTELIMSGIPDQLMSAK